MQGSNHLNGNPNSGLDPQHAWLLVKSWDEAALLPRSLFCKRIKTATYRFRTYKSIRNVIYFLSHTHTHTHNTHTHIIHIALLLGICTHSNVA